MNSICESSLCAGEEDFPLEEEEQLPVAESQGEERVPLAVSMQWPLIQLGRSFKNMVQAYRRFFSVSSEDLKSIYVRKAQRAATTGDQRARMIYMEKVLALDPDDVEIVYALGLAYEKNRELDKAHRCYQKVVRLQGDHVKANFRLGLIEMRNKELETAIASFEKALEKDPESADIYYRLGQAYDRKREHKRAIECFEKAVELDDDYLPAYKHMALTYDSMDDHRKALDCLKRALELEEMSA